MNGQIVPKEGVAEIVATRPGVVTRLQVKEGDEVRAGAPLATIDVGASLASGLSEQEAVGRALDREAAGIDMSLRALALATKAQDEQIASQQQSLRTDLAQIDQQLEFQQSLVDSASRELEQVRPLAARGVITQREINQRQDDLLARRQQLSKLRQLRAKTISDLQSAEQSLLRNKAASERDSASLLAQRAGLEKQRAGSAAQQSYVLNAPIDGTVTAVTARTGQAADPKTPLMVVIPRNATLEARLSVPSRAAGFIAAGQPVRLAIDAFPFESFGTIEGTIASVASAAQIVQTSGGSQAVYLTDIAIPDPSIQAFGERRRLVSGMSLTARIVTQRRSLFEWLFEPLYAVGRR